jgi:hypothetical protein
MFGGESCWKKFASKTKQEMETLLMGVLIRLRGSVMDKTCSGLCSVPDFDCVETSRSAAIALREHSDFSE